MLIQNMITKITLHCLKRRFMFICQLRKRLYKYVVLDVRYEFDLH
jgi:hypothetical protein